MFCSVLSMGISGIQGYMVTVEVDCQRGMPRFELVGLPDAAVKEARDRVRSAARNLGLDWPEAQVLVNLAPIPAKPAPSTIFPSSWVCSSPPAGSRWTFPTAPSSGSFPWTVGCGR